MFCSVLYCIVLFCSFLLSVKWDYRRPVSAVWCLIKTSQLQRWHVHTALTQWLWKKLYIPYNISQWGEWHTLLKTVIPLIKNNKMCFPSSQSDDTRLNCFIYSVGQLICKLLQGSCGGEKETLRVGGVRHSSCVLPLAKACKTSKCFSVQLPIEEGNAILCFVWINIAILYFCWKGREHEDYVCTFHTVCSVNRSQQLPWIISVLMSSSWYVGILSLFWLLCCTVCLQLFFSHDHDHHGDHEQARRIWSWVGAKPPLMGKWGFVETTALSWQLYWEIDRSFSAT